MKWSVFCSDGKAHLIRQKTVSSEENREIARTFCGKETSVKVDMWADKVAGITTCGICRRAMEKRHGKH